MCRPDPACAPASQPDHASAHTVAAHPEQGWSLLCNGVVLFDDGGELLPDGQSLPPQRGTPLRCMPTLHSAPAA
jgi:hypothetical protein